MQSIQYLVTLLLMLSALSYSYPIRADEGHNQLLSKYHNDKEADSEMLDNVLKRLDRSTKERSLGFTAPTEHAQEMPADQFKKYYACIHEKNKKYGEEVRQAMLFQEGQNVELPCNICRRPDQDIEHYSIAWKRLQQELGQESYVSDTGRFSLTKDKSLVIQAIDVLDAGQYACLKDGQYHAIYQIDVLFKEPRRMITEDDPESKPLDETYLVDHNLQAFTTWSEWSDCNKCDEKGIRRRVGLCTVKKISKASPITPVDMPSMKFYPDGVPCRSTILPRRVARLKYISDRQSETLIGKCLTPCPRPAKVETVTDSSGEVIKRVEVQYYSLNEAPHMPENVKREVMHKDAGRRLILTCPSDDSQTENMIRWQNGTTVINPLMIKRATRGRVRIDHSNRLLIRRVRVTDTAAYNCWEGSRHIATIKVIVTQPLNKDIKKYISLVGCAMTILAVIVIALSICCGKKKRTAR